MSRSTQIFLVVISDLIFINISYIIYYYIRIESGWIIYANPPAFLLPMIVIYVYWVLVFGISGLYRYWFANSRFDEFTLVVKTVSVGCLILFFLIFIDDTFKDAKAISRLLIFLYWAILIFFVSLGRLTFRSVQKKMLIKGIGNLNTVIVGCSEKAKELHNIIIKYPQLGHKFIGYVELDKYYCNSANTLGKLSEIKEIINHHKISSVLIALEIEDKEYVIETINLCSDLRVTIKIMPDMYEIISGIAKTQQIFGVPLLEVTTQLMPFHYKLIKRFIDIALSFFVLLLLSPVIIIIAILIKISSRGPVFYTDKRIGKKEKEFNLYKFRFMYADSMKDIPQWVDKNDKRITPVGKILRKTRLDDIPQFFNIIINNMSIVGPKPERQDFIEQLKKVMPYYSKRLTVKPGITGWAQLTHVHDSSMDDIKKKLQYDFYYIENMSLSLDFKIMINSIFVILSMKGR